MHVHKEKINYFKKKTRKRQKTMTGQKSVWWSTVYTIFARSGALKLEFIKSITEDKSNTVFILKVYDRGLYIYSSTARFTTVSVFQSASTDHQRDRSEAFSSLLWMPHSQHKISVAQIKRKSFPLLSPPRSFFLSFFFPQFAGS